MLILVSLGGEAMKGTLDYGRIGKRLKELREEHGYTQAQLAEAFSCSDGYVSQIERAISAPSLEFLLRASMLYRVPVDYLLIGSGMVLPEIEFDGRIKAQLKQAHPATLRAIVDMIDILLAQQDELQTDL